jgi:hypothetical protein
MLNALISVMGRRTVLGRLPVAERTCRQLGNLDREQLEHRVQMLLGVFSAKDVLPLEFKPAYSVGDLLTQHLDELEDEAERKGGVMQTLADHFAKVYKVNLPTGLAA